MGPTVMTITAISSYASATLGVSAPDSERVAVHDHLLRAVENSRLETLPYRHWFLNDMLTVDACTAITGLPLEAPHIGDTYGRRETHNSSRIFFSVENRACFPVCEALAAALQDPVTVAALEQKCGVNLAGSSLRIEYCQDTDGFWLEHHTDIGAKLFTLLIYLSTGPGSEAWGTDIMDEQGKVIATAPSIFNSGLIFIPGTDTWHGFYKRPITGVRKTLIVNYVRPEWRSRHELAYPEQPVVR